MVAGLELRVENCKFTVRPQGFLYFVFPSVFGHGGALSGEGVPFF